MVPLRGPGLTKYFTETLPDNARVFWEAFNIRAGEFDRNLTEFFVTTLPGKSKIFWDKFDTWATDFDVKFTAFIQGWATKLGEALRNAVNSIPGWVRRLVTGGLRILTSPGHIQSSPPVLHGADSGLDLAHGGIVPGSIGRPVLATVHGGEMVTPPGRGGGTTLVFNIGSIDSEIRVRQVAREVKRLIIEDNRRGVNVSG